MNFLERRHFLKKAGYGFGGTALAYMMERLSLSTAVAQPTGDYKALVCIFLNGGNDANNMIIPNNTGYANISYTAYNNVRNSQGLALSQSTLAGTPITPNTTAYGSWYMHPALNNNSGGFNTLYPLFAQGKLAVVANIGPLTQFMTRQQYQDSTIRKPYNLFSHSDQQEIWQTSVATRRAPNGWGGRIADSVPPANPVLPVNISVSGFPVFIAGGSATPLVISPAPTNLNALLVLNKSSNNADDQVRMNTLAYFTTIDLDNYLVNSAAGETSQTMQIAQYFNVSNPTFNTPFPNTSIANQLLQAARIIKLVNNTGSPPPLVRRQIFFCNLGGFDTHSNEINGHNTLYQQLSQAMRAFYDATVEMGLANQVTAFTLSDFGRTFQPTGSGAGSVGSDHGWGSHHLVLGGAVRGKDFYGRRRDNNTPVTIFPDMVLSGPSDTDSRGRWIPTVAVEQYANTLAKWFGLAQDNQTLDYVFPNLRSQFGPTFDLGFLNAT